MILGQTSGASSTGPLRFNIDLWKEMRAKRLVPTNSRIAELVRQYKGSIPEVHQSIFDKLLSHIDAFAAHVANDRVEYGANRYPSKINDIVKSNI